MPTPRCIVAATDFSGTFREALAVARDESGFAPCRTVRVDEAPA